MRRGWEGWLRGVDNLKNETHLISAQHLMQQLEKTTAPTLHLRAEEDVLKTVFSRPWRASIMKEAAAIFVMSFLGMV